MPKEYKQEPDTDLWELQGLTAIEKQRATESFEALNAADKFT